MSRIVLPTNDQHLNQKQITIREIMIRMSDYDNHCGEEDDDGYDDDEGGLG